MKLFGLWVGRPGPGDLDAVLAGVRHHKITYAHLGSTVGECGAGGELHSESVELGHGRGDFDAAVAGLRAWASHLAIGAGVHPADARLAEGAVVVITLPVGPFTAIAPDRVVRVIEEPDRVVFAYGTLPGHPERGEESFAVSLAADGVVRYTITVDAVPGNFAMRLASPVVKRMQRRALRGYLSGLADHVSAARRA